MADQGQTLTKRAVSAAKWNYLGNGVKVLLQFLIGVWLARLLGPEAFGVVAIAWLMIGVGKLISDFGFSAALIQRPDLTDRDVGYIFTVQVLIGLVLSMLGFVFASQIASFFNYSQAEPVIAVMAWLFIIQSLGQTTTAALNRALRFKFSQLANVATYLLGYVVVGLPMAYLGYGAWSLVVAQLTQAFFYTATVLIKSGVSIRPKLRPSKPGLFAFGGKVIGANLLYYINQNIDNFIVARALGVAQLGIYNRAMTLLSTPNNVIVSSLHSVLYSAACREQNKPELIKQSYLAATEFIGMICLPIFICVALVPETVVLGIYGESWSNAIAPMVPLALAMPVYAFLTIIGPVLTAANRAELEIYSQITALLVSAPFLIFAGMQSLEALSWAVLCAYFIRWLALIIAAKILIQVTFREVIYSLRNGFILSAPVVVVGVLINELIVWSNASAKLLLIMGVSFLMYLIAIRLFGRFFAKNGLLKLLVVRNALPKYSKYWLRLN